MLFRRVFGMVGATNVANGTKEFKLAQSCHVVVAGGAVDSRTKIVGWKRAPGTR